VQVRCPRWRPFSWHLVAPYADAVPGEEMAEAISLAMCPAPVPRFVETSAEWRRLILGGGCPPAPVRWPGRG
jgi:hypothetical protein